MVLIFKSGKERMKKSQMKIIGEKRFILRSLTNIMRRLPQSTMHTPCMYLFTESITGRNSKKAVSVVNETTKPRGRIIGNR